MCVCVFILLYLINKRVVHEVRAPDTEVENVNLLQDGVVEGVQEPRGVRNLGGEERGRGGGVEDKDQKTASRNEA